MRALIGPELLRKLPADGDIRDTKLTGFLLRCRFSGTHSYLVQLGRGRSVTIGRVGDIAPEAARLTAQSMLSAVSRETLKLMAEDTTINHREAKARARSATRGQRGGRRITWRRYVDDVYAPWAIENRKTGDETAERLRVQFAEFDTLLLTELSAFTIERWRSARLKSGVKTATTTRDLAALRSALTKAIEWGILKRTHPMTSVKPSKTDTIGHVRFLTDDEESRLLDALEDRDCRRRTQRDNANVWRRERAYDERPPYGTYTDHLTPIVLLALHTGCRRGELFELRWRDVDLVGSLLTVRAETAKSGQSRVIPLHTEIVQVLRAWQPTTVAQDAYVFPGDDGERMEDIKTAFLPLLKRATIEQFRFHDLRHSFASKLVMVGVDLNTVRELLGHADLKMTLRYAHLAPSHKAAAVAKLVRA
jgi:integrase